MTLREVIADAKDFSKQASDNTRWLAAGGLAVVWALAQGHVTELRRPSMSLAVLMFVLALLSDFLHYARATKRLVGVIERSTPGCTSLDCRVTLTRDDVPASAWFVWKTRCLVVAFVVLAWAFVMTVFPEVWSALRWLAAVAAR